MTALKKYERLESPGIWRETPEAQRRDVIVFFGDASLVLADSRSETPLSHWSLAAAARLNPGQRPALYAPGQDAAETLELDDDAMIEAIETVRNAIAARRARPGALRNLLLGGGLAAVVAIALFWLPGALIRHTAQVVPLAKRQEIGREVLADVARISGKACGAAAGARALAKLSTKLFGQGAEQIIVLRESPVPAAHAPGRVLLLRRDLIEGYDGPEVAAGYLLAEKLRAEARDPLADALAYAGLRATFGLLTTGNLSAAALHDYGRALLSAPPAPLSDEALLARFQAAGVPSGPYARAVDPSGETTLGLIEADPFAPPARPKPLLTDGEWVSLQGICAP